MKENVFFFPYFHEVLNLNVLFPNMLAQAYFLKTGKWGPGWCGSVKGH